MGCQSLSWRNGRVVDRVRFPDQCATSARKSITRRGESGYSQRHPSSHTEPCTRRVTNPPKPSAHSAKRWHTLTLMEQLGNVGSEVDRAIRAHETRNVARFDNALARALELFDLTAADDRWRGGRRREILRAREEFCRLFFAPDVPAQSTQGLRRYFLAFAASRRRRTDSA